MSQRPIQFLWNPDKAGQNLRMHRVSFEEAVTVFEDPPARIIYDLDHSDDENQEIIIGFSTMNRLLFVSYHERERDAIRLISARIATREERKKYEEKDY
jgi:uncharacterized protein